MIKPINNFVLIKVDPPKDKIGSIFLPESLQVKLNSGYVVDFSDKIKGEIAVGDHIKFMQYAKSTWYDKEHIIVPFESLNSRLTVNGELKAVGSKILVIINKEVQKSNRFVGSLKLLSPDFNNTYLFNNQFGLIYSVGSNVKESVDVGDIGLINHFVESMNYTLIEMLDNGDEIRVVETATSQREWYGYFSQRNKEWLSTMYYVFIEELVVKKEIIQLKNDLHGLTNNFFDQGNIRENMPELTCFTVTHSNYDKTLKKGDKILCKGKQAPLINLGIFYIPSVLIIAKLEDAIVSYENEKIIIELV